MRPGKLFIGNRRYSSWSMRGWLAVKLAKLDVEVQLIPLSGGSTIALKGTTPAGFVPYLEHDGARVWESLSICEYCAEVDPTLWPADRRARAHARSAASEMHSGFAALRTGMPMNLMRDFEGLPHSHDVAIDIARIDTIWTQARTEFGWGGTYLYGDEFGLADAMFAPVVGRFLSYRPELSSDASAYCKAVRAHPLVNEWYEEAAREPAEWRVAKYELLQP